MALVLKDRVKETSVFTGTGDISLGGASGAFQAFSVIGNGNQTYYAIAGQTTSEWEVGIGTYVSSGNKITRDTILSSSNSNAIVNFSAGTKDVFITYPSEKGVWVDASGTSNYAATIGSTAVNLGATVTTLAGLTSVTVTQDPSVALDLATKQYVDGLVSSGITFHDPVKYEVPYTTGNLTVIYNNGAAGVGATLTNAGTQTAFTPDGIVASVNDRVLVYNQTNATQNGVYTVTTVGSGSTNWVLTRATDANSYGLKDPNALGNGDAFFVASGNTGAGETYVCNTPGVITFGTTNITFTQITSSQVYNAGTGLTLSPATTFNIANTAVTPASYGAASKTLTATVNAQGQLTALADTNIAIAMSQVTSGTLGATQGGTGQSSYSIGDLLYADTTTTLAKLADVATGNALISGGLSTAPAWGKIGLTTHVSGTLGIANGGTSATTANGAFNALAPSQTGNTGKYLTTDGTDTSWATVTQTTFSAGTTGFTPATATSGAVTLAGTLNIANGGTGETTRQAAIDALAGATTSGFYLRGNGTDVVMAAIVAGDVPTLNQNTTGTASNVTGTVAILNGGTGQTSALAAYNALSPMTTLGDITYEGAGASAVRLGIGSTNQVLTVVGGVPAWANVSGGVTSLAGTANQITASASTGAVTLSTPSTFIAPGSIAATTTVTGTTINASQPFIVNSLTATVSYSIPAGSSASSAGPITVNSGVTITVPSGSRWVVL